MIIKLVLANFITLTVQSRDGVQSLIAPKQTAPQIMGAAVWAALVAKLDLSTNVFDARETMGACGIIFVVDKADMVGLGDVTDLIQCPLIPLRPCHGIMVSIERLKR